MRKKLDSLQLVLFSPGIMIVNKLKTATALNESLSNIFDGDPLIVPLPSDAPGEIPRIQLKSKGETRILSIARNRLDLLFRYKDTDETPFPIPDVFTHFLKIFEFFKKDTHTDFIRAAMVTKWVAELEKSTALECLLSKYIRSGAVKGRPYKLQLHYLTKESIAGLKTNRWTRIKTANKIPELEQNKFIAIEIDINTLAEEIYKFDGELLKNFLDEASMVTKDIMDTHLKRIEE